MNRTGQLFRALGVLAAAFLLLAGLHVVQADMNRQRAAHELTETAPLENAPPVIAFTTVALGGFRGLVADYLWLRANRLQDEGRYYELFQLASWIVKLQPRFTGATAYLAWNMSYNISVTCNEFPDRWRWVNRGIELIRDEALIYNPADPLLYKELAWIYHHKLGQDMDDANRYYKIQLARQMTVALGDPPVDWAPLIAAPVNETELRARLAAGSPLWTVLTEKGLSLRELEIRFAAGDGAIPEPAASAKLIPADRQTLLLYLRRHRLTADLKLDPVRLAALTKRYGPLDWRLPQAHAVYWAERGLEFVPGRKEINCERVLFQSLGQAFRSGRLIYAGSIETLETTPNLELFDSANQAYLDSINRHLDSNANRSGHENFLIDAAVEFYKFGRTRKAKEILEMLRKSSDNPKFRQPLDEFVLGELASDISMASQGQAQAAVQGYLVQSMAALAYGDDERAAAFELIGRKIWAKYMASIGAETKDRRGLAPFDQIKLKTLEDCRKHFPPVLTNRLPEVPKALPPPPAP